MSTSSNTTPVTADTAGGGDCNSPDVSTHVEENFSLEQIEKIQSEVLRSLARERTFQDTNVLVVGTHNAFYGNREKAEMFLPVYKEFVTRHHLLAWQEVDEEFLQIIAQASGHYKAFATEPNSRGQAVGFTVHDRFQVVETKLYTQVQNIENCRELRPSLRLDLIDTITGLKLSATVLHYKSNHGGSRFGRLVRRKQAQAQMEATSSGSEFSICLGDFNQFLGSSDELAPLVEGGFKLCPPYDRAITHSSGERLDGMLIKNVPSYVKVTCYRPRNYFRNPNIGCAISDHGLISWRIVVKGLPATTHGEV